MWTQERLLTFQNKHALQKGFRVSERGRRAGYLPPTEQYFRSGCCDGTADVVIGNLWNTKRDGWSIDNQVDGLTGLHLACMNKQTRVVHLLLDVGADWRRTDPLGRDVPEMARELGLSSVLERFYTVK